MSEAAKSRTSHRDRRVDERYEIDVPGGIVYYKGKNIPCRIVDVSLSGCCVRTESSFLAGNLADVDVVLPILGMKLRMKGITQWVRRENLLGIRFRHASPRSRNQLAGLLTCLVDKGATEEVTAAVLDQVQWGDTDLDVEFVEPPPPIHKPAPAPVVVQAAPEPSVQPAQEESSTHGKQDGAAKEEKVDWPAILRILKDGSQHSGVISHLSLEGCHIQTVAPFIAGIHIRVEVDFHMCGLPFLLAGVTEDVRDKHTVEVRFLDMSFRKRNELADAIEELRQQADKQSAA